MTENLQQKDQQRRSQQDGWPEYKLTVIKQLDNLTEEMRLIRETTTRIDKELTSNAAREDTQRNLAAAALVIQTKEYNRRFDELNNLQKQTSDERVKLVTDDKFSAHCKAFDEFKKDMEDWKEDVIQQMATHRGEDIKGRRVLAIGLVIAGVVVSIFAIIIPLFLQNNFQNNFSVTNEQSIKTTNDTVSTLAKHVDTLTELMTELMTKHATEPKK